MNDSNREQQDNIQTVSQTAEAVPLENAAAADADSAIEDSVIEDSAIEGSTIEDSAMENDTSFEEDDPEDPDSYELSEDSQNGQLKFFSDSAEIFDAEHTIPPFYRLYNSETPVNIPIGEKQTVQRGKHFIRIAKEIAGILLGVLLAAIVIIIYISSDKAALFSGILSFVLGYLVSGYVYDYAKLISCRLSGIKPLYIRIFCLLFSRKKGEKGKISLTLPFGSRIACPISDNTEVDSGIYVSLFSSGIIAMAFSMVATGIIAVISPSAISTGFFIAFAVKMLYSAIPAYNGGVPNDSVILYSVLHHESNAYPLLKVYGMFTAMSAGVRPSEIEIPDFKLFILKGRHNLRKNSQTNLPHTTVVPSSSADDFESNQLHLGEYAVEDEDSDAFADWQEFVGDGKNDRNTVDDKSVAEGVEMVEDEAEISEFGEIGNEGKKNVRNMVDGIEFSDKNTDAKQSVNANDDDINSDVEVPDSVADWQDIVSDIKAGHTVKKIKKSIEEVADDTPVVLAEDISNVASAEKVSAENTDEKKDKANIITIQIAPIENKVKENAVEETEDEEIPEVKAEEFPEFIGDGKSEQEQMLLFTEYLAALDSIDTEQSIFEIIKEIKRNIHRVPKSLLCTLRREMCFLSSIGANEESATVYLKKCALSGDVQSMRVLSYYCYFVEGDVAVAEKFLRRGIAMAQKAIKVRRCSVNCGMYICEMTLLRRLDNMMMMSR